MSKLQRKDSFLSAGRRNPPVSNEIEQIFNERHYDREPFISSFSRAFVLAYEMCEKHISTNHPTLPLFRAILQCFDPRFIQSNITARRWEIIELLKNFNF
ncbi:hypothetical protein RhiirA5_416136 [Rhizophagus irregularis]|uniref:Uncharacterized protein n=1 Tax=Rhizophagus irregularis TaxID=588596 RepID=A0A2N0PQI2_9GLOM|nr:hypothetical protein RhiirA5_416136 [Rhizophagus irregularis]